ncbi:hypothetical protein HCB18_02060 [Salinispora arenicola]|nr:hypothetical protein [Salinispora arenicola]
MTVEDRLGHGLLADGWHSGAVGVWMSGGVWLTLPRPGRERLAVPPALHTTWTGTRWQAAKRRGSRAPRHRRRAAALALVTAQRAGYDQSDAWRGFQGSRR